MRLSTILRAESGVAVTCSITCELGALAQPQKRSPPRSANRRRRRLDAFHGVPDLERSPMAQGRWPPRVNCPVPLDPAADPGRLNLLRSSMPCYRQFIRCPRAAFQERASHEAPVLSGSREAFKEVERSIGVKADRPAVVPAPSFSVRQPRRRMVSLIFWRDVHKDAITNRPLFPLTPPTRGWTGWPTLLGHSTEGHHESSGLRQPLRQDEGTAMKPLVVVADNPMIVGAIQSGLRGSGAFELLGYIDPRKASAARIVQAGAEVLLVDESENAEPAIELIRGVTAARRGNQGDHPGAPHGGEVAGAGI